jgi:hypothetical protein
LVFPIAGWIIQRRAKIGENMEKYARWRIHTKKKTVSKVYLLKRSIINPGI